MCLETTINQKRSKVYALSIISYWWYYGGITFLSYKVYVGSPFSQNGGLSFSTLGTQLKFTEREFVFGIDGFSICQKLIMITFMF